MNETASPVAYNEIDFSKISNGFFFTSDESSDFKTVKYYDLAQDKVTIDITGHIAWEVEYASLFSSAPSSPSSPSPPSSYSPPSPLLLLILIHSHPSPLLLSLALLLMI